MIERLEIENFRGLDKLIIKGLARVNVFVGNNDVGKTSVLEALYLLCRSPIEDPLPSMLKRRRYASKDADKRALELFRSQGKTDAVHVRGDHRQDRWHSSLEGAAYYRFYVWSGDDARPKAETRTGNHPHLGNVDADSRPEVVWFDFSSETDEKVAERIGTLWEERRIERLVGSLQKVDPRVRSVDQKKVAGASVVEAWVDLGLPRQLRLTQAGHGLRYATALLAELELARDAIVLVDEIEVGLHHDAMESVWRAIDALSKANNLQIFVTTHSYDCLKAVHAAMVDEVKDIAVFRLQRGDEGEVVAVSISGETLGGVIDLDLEVR